jgi:hypothetical protein
MFDALRKRAVTVVVRMPNPFVSLATAYVAKRGFTLPGASFAFRCAVSRQVRV